MYSWLEKEFSTPYYALFLNRTRFATFYSEEASELVYFQKSKNLIDFIPLPQVQGALNVEVCRFCYVSSVADNPYQCTQCRSGTQTYSYIANNVFDQN